MSYSDKQFEDIIDATHGKNGKKLPKDQAGLLGLDESWIHQLRKRHHGAANVPDHVIQTVTAAHEARLKQTASRAVQPVKHAEPEMAESSHARGTPESSPERVASDWSASPDERQPRQNENPVSSVVEETPYPQHARAAYRRDPLDWKQPLGPAPMSSQEGEEEELEVQLPCGETEQQEDANEDHFRYPCRHPSQRIQQTTMQMANTPPCAQPDHDVVPATVNAETTGRAEDNRRQRPVKRFKPISLGNSSPIKPKRDDTATRGSRMPSLKHLEVTETQDTCVSSSILPATLTQTQTQNATNAAQESHRDGPEEVVESSASVAEEAQSSSEELLDAKSPDSSGDEEDGENMEDLTPLAEFSAAYPDYFESYNGTQLNFVKACLCLEYLRGERALRDFLYDDFIRLFSYKYLDYVNGAGPNQEPLSAIEWFNMQSGQPLYNAQVIKNDNLDHVLTFYERKVATIRSLVAQHEQDEIAKATVVPKATEPEPASPTPVPLPDEAQEPMEVDEPETESTESAVTNDEVPAQDNILDERPIFPPSPDSPSSTFTFVDSKMISVSKRAVSGANPARSPQAASPQLGSRRFSAAPPSSMRSNAPAGTPYHQQLSTRPAAMGEEAARQRRERVRAAMRKRASASARSSSSKAGSVV